MAGGKWAVGDGLWGMVAGKWAVGDERWAVGGGQWEMGVGKVCLPSLVYEPPPIIHI